MVDTVLFINSQEIFSATAFAVVKTYLKSRISMGSSHHCRPKRDFACTIKPCGYCLKTMTDFSLIPFAGYNCSISNVTIWLPPFTTTI